MKHILLSVILTCFLSACCTRYGLGGAVIMRGTQRLCAKHHTALVTVRGSTLRSDHMCYHPREEYLQLLERFPNGVGFLDSLDPEKFSEPKLITYCPRCQAEIEKRLQ